MKAYGEVDVQIHIFLTSALVGGEWWASRSGRSTRGEKAHGTHWIGGWVGPRAGLDNVEKRKFLSLQVLELWPLDRPARSSSRYTDCAIAAPMLGEYSYNWPHISRVYKNV
jgi:hypothetical protein